MYYIVNFPKYAETATVQRAAFIMSGLQSAILAMTDKRRSLFENEYILVYLVRRCDVCTLFSFEFGSCSL